MLESIMFLCIIKSRGGIAMKRFVDRIEELSALDEEYRRPEASLVVV